MPKTQSALLATRRTDPQRGRGHISAGQPFHIATAVGAPVAYFFAADDEGELSCLEAGNDE
jgi:hypothetical protein